MPSFDIARRPAEAASPLTVLLVVHDHAAHLRTAFESIAAQSIFGETRLIVSDDASTDGSADLAVALARGLPNVTVRRNPHNLGIAEHYRALVRSLETEYVAILEGDDFWIAPSRLADLRAMLAAHPAMNAAFAAYTLVDAAGKPVAPRRPALFGGGRHGFAYFEDVLQGNPIGSYSNCMYRSDTLRDVLLNEAGDMVYDWPVNLLIAARGPIGYLEGDYGAYRLHEGGFWTSMAADEKQRWLARCLDAVRPRLPPRYRRVVEAHVTTAALSPIVQGRAAS